MSEQSQEMDYEDSLLAPPLYRRIRPWGKYAFVSSILAVATTIICIVTFIATFTMSESVGFVSFLFYSAIGFSIGALVFSIMGFGAGRDKLYAGLALIGPVLIVGFVVFLRFIFGVN